MKASYVQQNNYLLVGSFANSSTTVSKIYCTPAFWILLRAVKQKDLLYLKIFEDFVENKF